MAEKENRLIDRKITRRDFFKLTGLAAAGLGAGYLAGRLTFPPALRSLSLQAFLPQDDALMLALAQDFWHLTGGAGRLQVEGAPELSGLFRSTAAWERVSGGVSVVRVTTLGQPAAADLVLSDPNRGMYDPLMDFPPALAQFRQQIAALPADRILTIHFSTLGPAAGQRLYAVVRDAHGVAERLPLDRNFADIPLNGPFGKTHLRINDAQAWVERSACRHQRCQQTGRIGLAGEVLACAPNKLLVEIEAG